MNNPVLECPTKFPFSRISFIHLVPIISVLECRRMFLWPAKSSTPVDHIFLCIWLSWISLSSFDDWAHLFCLPYSPSAVLRTSLTFTRPQFFRLTHGNKAVAESFLFWTIFSLCQQWIRISFLANAAQPSPVQSLLQFSRTSRTSKTKNIINAMRRNVSTCKTLPEQLIFQTPYSEHRCQLAAFLCILQNRTPGPFQVSIKVAEAQGLQRVLGQEWQQLVTNRTEWVKWHLHWSLVV